MKSNVFKTMILAVLFNVGASQIVAADEFNQPQVDIDQLETYEDFAAALEQETDYRGSFIGACTEVEIAAAVTNVAGSIAGKIVATAAKLGVEKMCNLGCKYVRKANGGQCKQSQTPGKVGKVCECY
jgi:hypothetical protein